MGRRTVFVVVVGCIIAALRRQLKTRRNDWMVQIASGWTDCLATLHPTRVHCRLAPLFALTPAAVAVAVVKIDAASPRTIDQLSDDDQATD